MSLDSHPPRQRLRRASTVATDAKGPRPQNPVWVSGSPSTVTLTGLKPDASGPLAVPASERPFSMCVRPALDK